MDRSSSLEAKAPLVKGTLHESPPEASTEGPSTLYLLHFLTHATRTRVDEALRPLGLSSFNYTLLSVLARNEGQSSSQLSRRFHVTPQTMGETLAGLERKGLVTRNEAEGNRRVLRLALTPFGRDSFAAAEVIVTGIEREAFATLSPCELTRLRQIVGKLVGTLRGGPPAD